MLDFGQTREPKKTTKESELNFKGREPFPRANGRDRKTGTRASLIRCLNDERFFVLKIEEVEVRVCGGAPRSLAVAVTRILSFR